VMGNQAYADAFPSLIIIAQINTQKQLEGYLPWYAEAYRHDVAAAKHMLEAGKDDTGTPLTESARKQLQEGLSGVESVSAEFTTPMSRLPDLTFERELDVNLGNRDVQMKYLGRGNTTGDAIVYLPKENILVAGDLLDCPVPYFFGGYPAEQIVTLEKMAELDARTIVPGHGDVLHDKVYLNQVIALLKTVVSQTQQADYRTAGLISARPEDVQDAVMKAIDLPALRKQFAGDDPDNDAFFASSMAEIVKIAYWQRDY